MHLRFLTGAAAALVLAATSAHAQTPPADAAAAPAAPASTFTPIVANGTLIHTLQQAGHFQTLLKILDMGGLSGPALLGRPQPITLFAPTDEAFAAMAPGELSTLMQPDNTAKLQARFAYLIYNGALPWSQLKDHAGPVAGAGGPIYVDGSVTPPKANDAVILQPELQVSNGSVYVIDKVIGPGFTPPPPPAAEPEAAPAPEAAAPAKATKSGKTGKK